MNRTWPIDEVQKAWQVASKLHDGQKYGGPAAGQQIEYLQHLGSVAFEILNAVNHSPGMDVSLALTCSILHDTLEDTAATYDEINQLFGPQVAQGVLALSKDKRIEGRLDAMTDSLHRIKQQPKEVWAVKLADRISNLSAPPYYWNKDKKLYYIEESRYILKELKEGNHYLAERLSTAIHIYHQFIE